MQLADYIEAQRTFAKYGVRIADNLLYLEDNISSHSPSAYSFNNGTLLVFHDPRTGGRVYEVCSAGSQYYLSTVG